MVAPINIGLQFGGNWFNANKMEIIHKGGVFMKPSSNSSCNSNTNALSNKKRNTLLVTAQNKWANESTEHTALVTFSRGRFVEDKFVYRQTFFVRSHEIGPDKTITIETLMNFLKVSFNNFYVYICNVRVMFARFYTFSYRCPNGLYGPMWVCHLDKNISHLIHPLCYLHSPIN